VSPLKQIGISRQQSSRWQQIAELPEAKFEKRVVCDAKTDDEKRAHAIRVNLLRRNLSPDQQGELRKKQKAIARSLRESAPKRWTQAEVAKVLGVARNTVSVWFGSNVNDDNTSAPILDARVKVPPEKRPELANRVEKVGSRQAAADYGISERQARSIATAEKNAEAKKKARSERYQADRLGPRRSRTRGGSGAARRVGRSTIVQR